MEGRPEFLCAISAVVAAGLYFVSGSKKCPRADDGVDALSTLLTPPTYTYREAIRTPVTFVLEDNHKWLPYDSYPFSGGLESLAKHYKPNLPFLSRHKEWVPSKEQHHCHLYSSCVRRHSTMGHLYARQRSLEHAYLCVMREHSALVQEVRQLREQADQIAAEKESMVKTANLERELRKGSEMERRREVQMRDDLEREVRELRQQVMQLQDILHQNMVMVTSGGNQNGSQNQFQNVEMDHNMDNNNVVGRRREDLNNDVYEDAAAVSHYGMQHHHHHQLQQQRVGV